MENARAVCFELDPAASAKAEVSSADGLMPDCVDMIICSESCFQRIDASLQSRAGGFQLTLFLC
jgi:hypothetical protein